MRCNRRGVDAPGNPNRGITSREQWMSGISAQRSWQRSLQAVEEAQNIRIMTCKVIVMVDSMSSEACW